MEKKKKIIKAVVPVLIIILGVVIMMLIVSGHSVPERSDKIDRGVLVRTLTAEKKRVRVDVEGSGAVISASEVSVVPQVSGRVVYTAPEMKAGGFLKKSDVLFRIESVDYELAHERALSVKAKAEFDLEEMETRAAIARSEWERINEGNNVTPNPLVLFQPQLKNARAALASASAQVGQTMLDLERTVVTAPFDARVRSEEVETGQYVRAGNIAAVLAGIDKAEVPVPLTLNDIQWIDIPGPGKTKGSSAVVKMIVGKNVYAWEGHVVRSAGEVDPATRMMKVIIEVEDPYGVLKGGSGRMLVPGTFVDVTIKGRGFSGVTVVPRNVLHDNSSVWIMDSDGLLRIRNIEILRKERENVLVSSGLNDGDRVVLTNISGAADGMMLRTINTK